MPSSFVFAVPVLYQSLKLQAQAGMEEEVLNINLILLGGGD